MHAEVHPPSLDQGVSSEHTHVESDLILMMRWKMLIANRAHSCSHLHDGDPPHQHKRHSSMQVATEPVQPGVGLAECAELDDDETRPQCTWQVVCENHGRLSGVLQTGVWG